MAKVNKKENYCIEEERLFGLDAFYKSPNPLHNGYLPYCKECCIKMMNSNLKKMKTLESAMYFTCAELGIPFIRKVYDALEKKDGDVKIISYVANYLIAMQACKSKTDKWESFYDTDVDFRDIKTLRYNEASLESQIADLKLIWGKNENWTVEDYGFLEYQFDRYTEGLNLTAPQITLYRKLCINELFMRKKEEALETGDTSKEQKMVLDLMKVLKIDNFIEKKDKSLFEQTLENRIAVMEMTEPAFFYKDLLKYADHMGIGKYWEDHIIRPIRNVLQGQKEYNILPEKPIKETPKVEEE